jgi:outer membrane protein TolC
MMKSAKIIMLVLAAAASQALRAQEPMTLRECIDAGLEHNYEVRIVRNRQQMAENNATRANAGQLPTLDLGASFNGTHYDHDNTMPDGTTESFFNRGKYVDVGANLGWTLFDGFSLAAEYGKLRELGAIGELNTRMTLEDYVAEICSEYYTLIRQQKRLSNLRASFRLSRERLRIVEESYHIGVASGLDFQQAQVDFNADNSALIAQIELVQTIQIEMNEMMGLAEVERPLILADTTIYPNAALDRELLWRNAADNNVLLHISEKQGRIAELDLRKAQSRNYPYLRINAGYGYRHTWDNNSAFSRQNRLGFNYGVTAGITLFDGTRRSQQRNARLEMENSRLALDQANLALRSDMASIWLSYTNNLKLWDIEKENQVVARSNFEIAMERYRLRELSGIELREAQLSLLESEERLSTVEYNIKLCEISLYQLSGTILEILTK